MVEVSLKKIYIKKYEKVSGFKVWIVDGKYIRDYVEEEFTNYGQHYQFKFIPEDEFWIDKERSPGEEQYFIDSMLAMHRLITKGMKDREAAKIADRIEKRERSKSKLMKNEMKIKKHNGNLIKTIHRHLLKEYNKWKIKIWIVKGEVVRDLFFLDFTEGGHDRVYSFIPENEVWIDDDLDLEERKFVILHEMHERNLMGKGKTYNEAHKSSSKIEYYCRKHPKKLDRFIRREFRKAERSLQRL
jgi:hypothetical protein